MKLGDVVNIQGVNFRLRIEFCDGFLALSEEGFSRKMLPKLQIIK